MKIKPLRNFWVCVNDTGNAEWTTISYSKKTSIVDFLHNSKEKDWKIYEKEYGWKCIKVNVYIEPVLTHLQK